MGNGDIVVGSKPSVRKPKAVVYGNVTERLDTSAPGPVGRHCGAMSQQPRADGAGSMPQKFLHLVGCHDPKAGARRTR